MVEEQLNSGELESMAQDYIAENQDQVIDAVTDAVSDHVDIDAINAVTQNPVVQDIVE